MRVDASQVLAGSGVNVKSSLSSVTDSLKEGNDAGIRADDDLSIAEKSLVRSFEDKSLAPYAAKLAELNMPVTEESARAMRDILSQNPKLSMDEAAFLASNKLTGDDSLMKAALDVLSGGDKTDAMIAKLLSSLGENPLSGSGQGAIHVSAQNTATLTEFITLIVKSTSSLGTIITQPDDNMQLNVKNTEEFFAKTVENTPNNTQNAEISTQNTTPGIANNPQMVQTQNIPQDETLAQEPTQTGQPEQGAQSTQAGTLAGEGPSQSQNIVQGEAQVLNEAADKPAGDVKNPQIQEGEALPKEQQAQSAQPDKADNPQQAAKTTSSTVAKILSQVPEFKGTPQSALERFSNMLLRVAGDTEAASGTDKASQADADKDTKMLAAQLEKMFTKIGKNDENAGMRLREAREELFARLSLIEEEISRATGPEKTQLLSQTQKLMDHVRLLNNIDQFTYLQLPVQLREERKSAELYVFKRKGGKRADPDNVNILLAIDLEFMGHWEALLNIKGKDVYINMEVQGEAEKNHFIENTVMLHEMLKEEGFKLVNTNIKISEEETTPLTALLALDRYTGGHQGKIDFFY